VVKLDDGLPFNSPKFEDYTQEEGFKHRKVTPKWQESPHYKPDRSMMSCAGGSEHIGQLNTKPLELAHINLCLGMESSHKPADNLSTPMPQA